MDGDKKSRERKKGNENRAQMMNSIEKKGGEEGGREGGREGGLFLLRGHIPNGVQARACVLNYFFLCYLLLLSLGLLLCFDVIVLLSLVHYSSVGGRTCFFVLPVAS
jgi:hypothetical protein